MDGNIGFYICIITGIIGAILLSVYFIYLLLNIKDPANRLTIKYINMGIICCVIYGLMHNIFCESVNL